MLQKYTEVAIALGLLISCPGCGHEGSLAVEPPVAPLVPVPTGSIAAAAEAPEPVVFVIYSDAPANHFADYSWCNRNLAQTDEVLRGSRAISMEPDRFRGLQLGRTTGVQLTPYHTLGFWLHGGSVGGQRLFVGVTGQPGGAHRLPLEPYLPGGVLEPGTWEPVQVPLADLGVAGGVLLSVYLQDASGADQGTVYVDEITLLGDAVEEVAPATP